MSEESTDFSKYNIEDLLLNEVSVNVNNQQLLNHTVSTFRFLLIQIYYI